MADIQHGRIRVPRFQREFVWERSRILKLFDSMLVEYPIGTIFLWNAPSEYNHLLRDIEELAQPKLHKHQNYQLILDGQQRLTSLYAVIHGIQFEGEDYGKFVVDLELTDEQDSPFRYRNPDNKRWISVKELLSGGFAVYDGLPNSEAKQRFRDISDALRGYPFSVVTVSDMQIDDAIVIFERINQQGRKLSRYDLICASVMTEEFDLRERSEKDVIDKLSPKFGEIEETSIPQALALNSKHNTEYKSQLDLTTEQIQQIWLRTVDCFSLAVDFVKENLGVARVDFLPYDAILPVLNNYFYHSSGMSVRSSEHRDQLERWFWLTAFAERYSGASQTRMNEDVRWIRQLLERNESVPKMNIADDNRLVASKMRTTSAIRNGVLCLLNVLGPQDFRSKEKINLNSDHFSRFTRAERHHIFPVGFLKNRGLESGRVHSIPNFCFIPRDTNSWIGDRAPSDYMRGIRNMYSSDEEFLAVMRTHLIPVGNDSGIWTDNYELFLKQRARLLIEEIKVRCGISTSLKVENRDPVVNKIEVALRDHIHHTMLAHGTNYWKQFVTSDVQKRVENAIDRYVGKTPGTKKRDFDHPRKKLDHCDVSDYGKIISNGPNWALFSGAFKNQNEARRTLDDFREYRAALKHNREINNMLDHRAQAAILWLRNALELDLGEFGI